MTAKKALSSSSPPSTIDVEKIQRPMVEVHQSGINKTYEWRIQQLKQLQYMLQEHQETFVDAIIQDFHRDPVEAITGEIQPCVAEVNYMIKHLRSFMKPQIVSYPALLFPCYSTVENVPLPSPGVLIIGPSNYPLHLVLRPLVGVLAGGNPAVIKPSDLTPHTSQVLSQIIPKYFDSSVVQVILGGIPETTSLLSKSWGKVVFTGSERVGRVVARACAETLTPCVLELGGKCWTVIDETIATKDLTNVADRLVFSKCFNAGQTCVAPDSVLVHERHADMLCAALKHSLETQFGSNPKQDDSELPRIVSTANTKRLISLIEEVETTTKTTSSSKKDSSSKTAGTTTTTIVTGGSKTCDVEDRYVAPTVVLNPPKDSKMLTEEIFGPILPIVTYSTREEAIQTIQNHSPGIPLYLYVFCTDDKVFQLYKDRCPSGGAVRNDSIIQLANHNQPFGGAGTSGYGEYYGKYSYKTFTNHYPVTYRPLGSMWDFQNLRCHPFKSSWKGKIIPSLLVLPELPSISSSQLRFGLIGACVVVVVAAAHVVGPGSLQTNDMLLPIRYQLASMLESIAAYLRK